MTVAMDLGWQLHSSTSVSTNENSSSSVPVPSGTKHVWSEDPQKILSLMMGRPADDIASAATILPYQPESLQLDEPLPSGWEKRLDLKSGSVSFVNCSTGMSTFHDPRRAIAKTTFSLDLLRSAIDCQQAGDERSRTSAMVEDAQVDLELNLGRKSPTTIASSSKRNAASQERITVTGCKSCLMYVMLSPTNPQCPRCGSNVVLDIYRSPILKKFKA